MSVGVRFLDDLLHLESVVFLTTKKLPWGATVPPYLPFWTAILFLRLNSFNFKDIFTQKLTQIKLISTKKQHFSSARQMGDEVSPQATNTFKTKLVIFKCLKRKRLIISYNSKLPTLPSSFFKRYIKSRRSPKPAQLFSIISSIILSQNTQSYCQVLFCILPFFPSSTSTFLPNQSITTPEEKNSCNVRTYNGWKSSLLFSTKYKLKRSPIILANAFFYSRKFFTGKKCNNEKEKFRDSAQII